VGTLTNSTAPITPVMGTVLVLSFPRSLVSLLPCSLSSPVGSFQDVAVRGVAMGGVDSRRHHCQRCGTLAVVKDGWWWKGKGWSRKCDHPNSKRDDMRTFEHHG
jgi:hypothetical protein